MQTKHGKQKEDCCFTVTPHPGGENKHLHLHGSTSKATHFFLPPGQTSPASLIRLETIPTCSAQEEPKWLIFMKDRLATDQRQPFKIQVNLVRWSFRKQPPTHGGPNLRSNYSFMKKTPCILQVFVWGDISDGRDKAHMSKQPVGFSFSTKLTLGKKTWLGRPAALTVGMFVCGNNSVNILRSDG